VQAIIGATQKRQGLKSVTSVMAALCLFCGRGKIIAQLGVV